MIPLAMKPPIDIHRNWLRLLRTTSNLNRNTAAGVDGSSTTARAARAPTRCPHSWNR